jgi:crossover junction endodeoxyribonuclease RusA
MTTILLAYPPSTNRAWRMANGRMIQPAAVKAWKHAAQWTARAAGMPQLAGAVRIVATLHPRMTKDGKASKRRLDLDNSIKMALDALNGVAYGDDKQVIEVVSRVGYPLPEGGLTLQVETAVDCAVTLAGASVTGH